MVAPNTFILGAPKCATTSLATWLAAHPQVFLSAVKEPHYFYSPYHEKISLVDYKNLFSGASGEEKVICEASVWYLFSQVAVPKILEFNPSSRFIVCLRHPVELAVSLHAQALSSGHEGTRSFSKAWSYSDQRYNSKAIGVSGPKFDCRILAYKQACYLGSQLKSLYTQVSRSKVHIIFMDDLKINPREEWLRLESFLGLEDDGKENFEVLNVATQLKSFRLQKILNWVSWFKSFLGIKKSFNLFSGLHKKNLVKRKYNAPSEALKAEMQVSFEEEISLLESLTGRDLSAWR